MKEILKIRCQISILMKKVIILKKIQATMKTFTPPSFNYFSLRLRRKKTCVKENHEKETKHISASAADLLHIKIGNLNWCKCGHCKNEVREIDCLCCRKVDAILIASAKIPQREGNISRFLPQ